MNNLDRRLQEILSEHCLNKGQLARQLKNFKLEKYGNSQIAIIIDADQLEEKMRMSLSMMPAEFVASTLDKILAVRGLSSLTSDFEKFAKILDDFPQPKYARTVVSLISGNPTNGCTLLLIALVDHWFVCAAEKFPKTAAGLPNAEIEYQKIRKEYKSNVFMPEWKEQYKAFGIILANNKLM